MKKKLPTDIRDLSPADLAQWIKGQGVANYRGEQLVHWLYREGVADFGAMKNLPQDFKNILQQEFTVNLPTVVTAQRDAEDTTTKLLLGLGDGERVECVLIPETVKEGFTGPRPHRKTLCVSSQVGCAMGCTFCRTATMGLKRNLTPSEILGQVLCARQYLKSVEPEGKIRNIVFMGMGEPLHNYKNVVTAIAWLTDPKTLGFSKRRVTVSTSGLLPEIKKLLRDTHVQIAVSLNATTEKTRAEIMPINKKYSLSKMMDYLRALPEIGKRRILFEYVLLAGVNDSPEDAKRLVGLLHGLRAKVNLLSFNEFSGSPFKRASDATIQAFCEKVRRPGLQVNIRKSRGRKVLAACGQLATEFQGALK